MKGYRRFARAHEMVPAARLLYIPLLAGAANFAGADCG
jgi:hypothetical protein